MISRMIAATSHLLLIIASFFLAGLVKGVTGLGLPTVGIGLLSLVMLPTQAAALIVVPSLATNIWQMTAGPALAPLIRRLWPMQLGVCVGTWSGANAFAGTGMDSATAALGIALLVYAALGLSPVRLPRPDSPTERWLGPAIGAATGVATAATGVFVVPAVPYLQALGLDRDKLVQALGLSFTVSTIALAASLAATGAFGIALAWTSLLSLVPAFVGMAAGQWIGRAVRPDLFRHCFFVGLLLLGGHLLVGALL